MAGSGYEIRLYGNGGIIAYADLSVQLLILNQSHLNCSELTLSRNGYLFKGFGTSPDGPVVIFENDDFPEESASYYAIWEDLLGQISLNSEVLTETTSDATAKAEEISEGKTAYVKGQKLTGTMKKFPNGTEWTQSNITSGGFQPIYNANGIWVAGGGNSKLGLYYSTDGKTWTQSNITSGSFRSIYNANGIWVAAGGGSGLYYSADGKTWTQSNITSGNFRSIYNANGIWVAGSYSSSGLYYSIDGKTWTQSNITSGRFNSIYNANGIWVAASGYNLGLYYSADGKTWTRSNITSDYFYSVYNANGIWVAAGGSGLYYSVGWEPSE